MAFGYKLRESSFQFDDDVVNLNHGSYGACPRDVLDARIEGIRSELAFPDAFYRMKHEKVTDKARRVFAKELGAPLNSVVCVTNATLGVNVALGSYLGDKNKYHVLMFSTTYKNTVNLVRNFNEKYDWTYDVIGIPLDVASPQQILDLFESQLKGSDNANRIAIIDTVSSMPSIRFPWEEMVALCRKYKVEAVVDGAHGLGLIPLSLDRVRPSFFVTNAHKWFYTAHSVAALYVNPDRHHAADSVPIGVIYETAKQRAEAPENWHKMFDNVGTSDRSAVYAIPAAAKFREEELGGTAKAIEYQNKLSAELSKYLCGAWQTTEIGDFGEQYRTALVTLRCPFQPADKQGFVEFAYVHMMETHRTLIPLFVYEDTILMRFSAAVYVELNDFKHGKRVIDATIAEWKRLHAEA